MPLSTPTWVLAMVATLIPVESVTIARRGRKRILEEERPYWDLLAAGHDSKSGVVRLRSGDGSKGLSPRTSIVSRCTRLLASRLGSVVTRTCTCRLLSPTRRTDYLMVRRISVVIVAVVAVAVALLITFLPGRSHHANAESHSPYVMLTNGTYQGTAWRLFAWKQGGYLCMELDPAGSSDPGNKPSASPGQSVGAGACEFDKRNPSGDYYTSGPGPAGSDASFGPLPTNASQIRVATHEILPTMPLPTAKGLPAGRYWINIIPVGWPTPTDGTALDTPQPIDISGKSVKFQSF